MQYRGERPGGQRMHTYTAIHIFTYTHIWQRSINRCPFCESLAIKSLLYTWGNSTRPGGRWAGPGRAGPGERARSERARNERARNERASEARASEVQTGVKGCEPSRGKSREQRSPGKFHCNSGCQGVAPLVYPNDRDIPIRRTSLLQGYPYY